MPIEIEYTDDTLGVIFSAVGKVTGKEIIDKQKDVYRSKEFPRLRYWIVDRSRCTEYDVSTEEVSEIAAIDNEAAHINPHLIMALVAESDLQFGISRMYESQITEKGFTTEVFREREAAERWIFSKIDRNG